MESLSQSKAQPQGRDLGEKSPARLKRPHNKARTGCITCRKRRLKCDEFRPFCRRCAKAQRPCVYKEVTKLLDLPSGTAEPTSLIPWPYVAVTTALMRESDMTRPLESHMEHDRRYFMARSTAFGCYTDLSTPMSYESMMQRSSALPDRFSSLVEAGEYLQTAMYRALLLHKHGQPYDVDLIKATRQFVNEWSIKFDSCRFTPVNEESPSRSGHLLLLAQHRMVQLLLKAIPPENDANYYRAAADFRIMFAQLRTFLDTGTQIEEDETLASPVHSGLIVPLFFIATKCRQTEISQMALETLQYLRVIEGYWNSCIAHAIASKLVEIEGRYSKAASLAGSPWDSLQVRLDGVERLSCGKLNLICTAVPPDGSTAYTSSEIIHQEVCQDVVNMPWLLNRMILNYGFQGPVKPRSLACRCQGMRNPDQKALHQVIPQHTFLSSRPSLQDHPATSDFDSMFDTSPTMDNRMFFSRANIE